MTDQLPERVLQFGTGILLRGLPDFFIDKANREGLFNGKILVVKSTAGAVEDVSKGYTTIIRGLEQGIGVQEEFINRSISRVVSAFADWPVVLRAAATPQIEVILSNTTEAGLQLTLESVSQSPPTSFPAKLAACLFERFNVLGETAPKLLVIPTELVPDNGTLLKGMVEELILFNDLGAKFRTWLDDKVIFCNSLVDRIVAKPSPAVVQAFPGLEATAIQTEPYRLWAIEGDEEVKALLPFSIVDHGMIVANDIRYYRERKLRLLNGTHTILVCLAFLKGHDTVYSCMQDADLRSFAEGAMKEEILPTLTLGTPESNLSFASEVLDRFSNPFTEHRLISITLQSTLKMKMRVIPPLLGYVAKYHESPTRIAKGFAAYLLFLKSERHEDGSYYGKRKGVPYPIKDDAAQYFYEGWQLGESKLVHNVCREISLWGEDLSLLPGFEDSVLMHLVQLQSE